MRRIEKLDDLDGERQLSEKRPIRVVTVQLTEEIEIATREGLLRGYPGDWVIEGIEGEIYPCGKDIFEKTYRRVEPTAI
ncbi:hypothetical protein LCGC14_2259500 [marine sediment metagenome]|uniref:Uncharacterized protein n=1 Tax=marine sediment metagenome TaxID=412755 RepID=A0A0F9D041_9ZZZZ